MNQLHKLIAHDPEAIVQVVYVHKNGELSCVTFSAKNLLDGTCEHDGDYFGELKQVNGEYTIKYFAYQEKLDKEV